VGLRVHHDFRVPHPGSSGALQVRPGHVREVLLSLQHGHVGVVQVEEGLQVRELVPRPQLIQVREYGS
jgi:hypothetical protein